MIIGRIENRPARFSGWQWLHNFALVISLIPKPDYPIVWLYADISGSKKTFCTCLMHNHGIAWDLCELIPKPHSTTKKTVEEGECFCKLYSFAILLLACRLTDWPQRKQCPPTARRISMRAISSQTSRLCPSIYPFLRIRIFILNGRSIVEYIFCGTEPLLWSSFWSP